MTVTARLVLKLIVVLAACIVGLAALGLYEDGRIDKLEGQVACLQHPHGESSIAGKLVGSGKNRHFVVTQQAHRTGC